MTYQEFLQSKTIVAKSYGLEPKEPHEILFDFQRDIVKWALRLGRACAWLDCVAGETVIQSPDGDIRIDEAARLGKSMRVYSLKNGKISIQNATAPWINGYGPIYEIKTTSGRSIRVTKNHRLFTKTGWKKISSFSDREQLLASAAYRPPSNLESVQSIQLLSDRSSFQKAANYLSDCFEDYRLYDGQPLSPSNNDRSFFPSQDDVRAHNPFREQMDGTVCKYKHSYHHQHNALRSKLDFYPPLENDYGVGEGYYFDASFPKPFSIFAQSVLRYQDTSRLERLESEQSQSLQHQTMICDSYWDTVTAIQFVRNDWFFDLHVPGVENYFANGLLSHNCGLGKTFCQVSWANQIPGDVLILAPLAVTEQTVDEAKKIDVKVRYCRDASEVRKGITVTNYQMLSHFDCSRFKGVALDESSILKSLDGATRNLLVDSFSSTPYRSCWTATPAPNDVMELGNHVEFLGLMTYTEMLSMFFTHDGGETQKWRLKGHATKDFWKWVSSWAVMMRKPSDLGYADRDFILPPLEVISKTIAHKSKQQAYGLLPWKAATLPERIVARRESIPDRVRIGVELVAARPNESWLIWCHLNKEGDLLQKSIPGCKQVSGGESIEVKTEKLMGFRNGKYKVLVTKPKIAGHGLNLQICSNVIFIGLSDSWEQYYQAIRRCWRFGQKRKVTVYVITAEAEGAVLKNILRKEADAEKMLGEMLRNMKDLNKANIKGQKRVRDDYVETIPAFPDWLKENYK